MDSDSVRNIFKAKAASLALSASAPSDATIDADVPLPGSFVIKVYSDLDVHELWDGSNERTAGGRLHIKATATSSSGSATYDINALWELWATFARRAGLPERSLQLARPDKHGKVTAPPDDDPAAQTVKEFATALERMQFSDFSTDNDAWGQVLLPVSVDDGIRYQTFDPSSHIIVEQSYRVTTFPTRFGLGKTVHTMTLLPGEQQELKLRTWRTSKTSSRRSSSVVDSFDDSSKESFQNELSDEQQGTTATDDRLSWNVQASASASFFGMASAAVSGGASGEHKLAASETVKGINKALQSHAAEANRNRKTSVETTDETSDESGDEATTVRTIKNVNLRRTLNFVFRELNQVYETIIHLEDLRVGFRTGIPGDITTSSLAHAREFFGSIGDAVVLEVIRQFGVLFDDEGNPVQVVQRMEGPNWIVAPDKLTAFADLPAPKKGAIDPELSSPRVRYRFKRAVSPSAATIAERDAIAQESRPRKVPGLVVSRDEIVMKTPALVVEALLGSEDALDSFALRMQEATVKEKELSNDRTSLGVEIATTATEKPPAFATVFYPPATSCCATTSK